MSEDTPKSDSLGEDVAAAYKSLTEAAEAPVSSSSPQAGAPPVSPAREGTDAAAERARDATGRFARKEEAARMGAAAVPAAKPLEAPKPATPAAVEPPPAEAPKPSHKPPQAWKAELREKWGALPPEVQAEVSRRELEMSRALSETAQARQVAEGLGRILTPHLPSFGNQHPFEAINEALNVRRTLQSGTPQAKAQMLASLVSAFHVPVEVLDEALAASVGSQPAPRPQDFRDPRVDQLLTAAQQLRAQRAQDEAAQIQETLSKFAETHEHLPDVEDTMAALITASRSRGVEMSLEDAYTRACRAHPEVWARLEQQTAAQQARMAQAATQASKAAASSPKSSPVVAPRQSTGSLRDDILAAADSLTR